MKHIAVERNVWKKTPEAIQKDFPQLSSGQIFAALAYYCDHQEQIDAEIAAEERFVEQMRSRQSAPLTRAMLAERLPKRASGA